jgi:hypothetical protein
MNTWYLKIPASQPISQGDILFHCPVFKNIPMFDWDDPRIVVDMQTVVDYADVVVMTQACDLEDCSAEMVNVAMLHDPLKMKVKSIKENDTDAQKRNKHWDVIKKIRDDRMPNFALISDYSDTEISMGYKVVDFSTVFTLPYDMLMNFREYSNKRLRLNTPHRELLSQKYGNYFARIGLPNDDFINPDKLRSALQL